MPAETHPTARQQPFSLVYYTDSVLNPTIAVPCLNQIKACAAELGVELITVGRAPGPDIQIVDNSVPASMESLFVQLKAGVKAASNDLIFTVEHDCLYLPEHFVQPSPDHFRANLSVIRVHPDRIYTFAKPVLSMFSGPKNQWLDFCDHRLKLWQDKGSNKYHFCEPGCRVGDIWKWVPYRTEYYCLDIRHGNNCTKNKDWLTYNEREFAPGWGESLPVRTMIFGDPPWEHKPLLY